VTRLISLRVVVILAHAVALVLLVWAAWSASQRLPFFANRGGQEAPTTVARAEAPRSTAVPVSVVEASHLFGSKPVEGVQPSAVDAPETRLKLTLTGVFASPRQKIAHAIIEVEAQPPKSYGVGDSIEKTDAKLHSVEPNRVLLDRNGQLEALLMVRAGLGGDAGPGAANTLSAPEPAPERDAHGARLEGFRRSGAAPGTKTF